MKRRRTRARTLFLACSLTTLAVVTFLAYHAAPNVLRTSLAVHVDAATLEMAVAAAQQAVLVGAALTLGVAIALAFGFTTVLTRQLQMLRERANSMLDDGAGGDPFGIAEIDAMGVVLDRIGRDARRGSARLRHERDEATRTLDLVGEGILRLDASERVLWANRTAERLLMMPDDVAGRPVGSFVRQAELRELLGRAGEGATVQPTDVYVGDHRLLVAATPVPGLGDSVDGAVVTLVDLTELRRLEGVRRDFVANVSHELKTPLTSIRGYAETLLDGDVPADTARRFMETIQSNADRLHSIVDDLLDLSRLESGGWLPATASVDVERLGAEILAAFRERAAAARVAFDVRCDGPATVWADSTALRQILANLLDNALRHTDAGGSISLCIVADPGGDHTAIEVADTGSGIPAEALDRVFERFYRADPARSRGGGGTGLGLAIVKHLTEQMRGRVEIESELGRGTRVRILLPGREGGTVEPSAVEPSPGGAATAIPPRVPASTRRLSANGDSLTIRPRTAPRPDVRVRAGHDTDHRTE